MANRILNISSNRSAKNQQIILFILAIVFSGLCFLGGASFVSSLAILLSVYFFLLFTQTLGNYIPIMELMVFLCALQWLVGPVLAYAGYSHHYKYYMYIDDYQYFPFVIIGLFMFYLGNLIVRRPKERFFKPNLFKEIKNRLSQNQNIAYYIIIVGWICSILQRFMPGGLNFIFYLLANMMYVGVIYLLFQPSRFKWGITIGIMLLLFISSLQSSMFHGLILWLTFISIYAFTLKNYGFQRKLLFFLIGIVFVYFLQIAKWEIRNGRTSGDISGFFGVVSNELLKDDEYEDTKNSTEEFVVRLNQGWIISRIMYYIPNEAPFVDGETVEDAISATLLPRFLSPDKTVVGGKEYFEKFTGFQLLSSTSMGASLLGEGYANFGYNGAIAFMFIVGMFFRLALNTIYRIANKYPTIILWIPLIFLQVVKAESDLVRVLNHLVKASILVFVIYWFCYKVLKVRI